MNCKRTDHIRQSTITFKKRLSAFICRFLVVLINLMGYTGENRTLFNTDQANTLMHGIVLCAIGLLKRKLIINDQLLTLAVQYCT